MKHKKSSRIREQEFVGGKKMLMGIRRMKNAAYSSYQPTILSMFDFCLFWTKLSSPGPMFILKNLDDSPFLKG